MRVAVELYFDNEATRRVRSMWSALDDAGVVSLGAVPGAEYEPHVSLAVFETADPERVTTNLVEASRRAIGLDLVLAALGFFLTEESVAFLGVVPTKPLLDVHSEAHLAIGSLADRCWPHYDVDSLFPHCTLATGVADKAAVIAVMETHQLPVVAHVDRVALVKLPAGHTIATIASA